MSQSVQCFFVQALVIRIIQELMLTPGLHAKSTSVGCSFGPNDPKSKNKVKNAQNTKKTILAEKIFIFFFVILIRKSIENRSL